MISLRSLRFRSFARETRGAAAVEFALVTPLMISMYFGMVELSSGVAIDRSHNVVLVFAVVGLLVFLIPLGFSFTALGRSERYMPARQTSQTSSAG